MPLCFASCEILSLAKRGIAKPAAYGERAVLTDENGTVLYRPRRSDDPVAAFTLLPQGASPDFNNPRILWNAVERRARSMGHNRVVGLGLVLGLPREHELDLPECVALVRRVAERLHRGRLPVRADIHRVVDGDGLALHRHAHLIVGLFAVAGGEIDRTLDRRFLPVIRGRLVHALDWPAIWAFEQAQFFKERRIELGVPPAFGLGEPNVVGRPRRGTRVRRAGRTREEVRDDVRSQRGQIATEPQDTMRTLTRTRMSIASTELDAFLSGTDLEPDLVAPLKEAILSHGDTVGVRPAGWTADDARHLTCRNAIERARSVLAELAAIPVVSARLMGTANDAVSDLREISCAIDADIDSGRRLVVVWSDAWLRREVEDRVAWPRGCRRIAAGHLSALDGRDAAVLRWSPATTVIALSADRLDDVAIGVLVRRASRAGAALRLGVVPEGPAPRAERGIAPLAVEHVLGARLPLSRDDDVALQILRQRLSWRAVGAASPTTPHEGSGVTIRSEASECCDRVSPERLDGTEGGPSRRDLRPAVVGTIMSPRQAWREPPSNAVVTVQRPSDWLWAGELLRQHPSFDVSFTFEGHDDVFLAAVMEHMRWGRDALRALIERAAAGPGDGDKGVARANERSRKVDRRNIVDSTHPGLGETDGLDLDTDLDDEMAAAFAFGLDLEPHGNTDLDADDIRDDDAVIDEDTYDDEDDHDPSNEY